MSRVRTKGTKPEEQIRRALLRSGIRYRLHRIDLPGKPDFYIGRLRLAIFVNGCFWHGHTCSKGKLPVTNVQFWREKIGRNQKRDELVRNQLQQLCIKPTTIWECQVLAGCDLIGTNIESEYHNSVNHGKAKRAL